MVYRERGEKTDVGPAMLVITVVTWKVGEGVLGRVLHACPSLLPTWCEHTIVLHLPSPSLPLSRGGSGFLPLPSLLTRLCDRSLVKCAIRPLGEQGGVLCIMPHPGGWGPYHSALAPLSLRQISCATSWGAMLPRVPRFDFQYDISIVEFGKGAHGTG